MGRFHHGDASEPVDDVDLAHLELVVAERLGRSEPFLVTVDDGSVDGATSYWVAEDSPLRFAFGSLVPESAIDAMRLRIMLDAADGDHGLHVARAA
ncbi:hypothetical protein GCM10009846_00730 [Agrococcus versicolor]|uniref:DUF7882 domain-containing protein n=1 Tax=Agrococcus versicolor TaxID=501482 RepID=A0ABP5MCU6_9MICO